MRFLALLTLLLATVAVLYGPVVQAQNLGLVVAPTQVIFTPKMAVYTMSATNRSNRPMHYKLILSDEVMNAQGGVETQAEGFAYSARRLLRFMPDEIRLKPNEGQRIRILVRRPENLAPGDYHSHLIFEEQKPEPPVSGTAALAGGPDGGQAKFGVTSLLSIGIPLIVQQGPISASLTLLGMNPVKPRNDVGNYPPYEIRIARSGNATGRGFLTLRTPAGADLINPRSVSLYREVDEVTMLHARTPLGETYKGPATLLLTESKDPSSRVIGKIDVAINF